MVTRRGRSIESLLSNRLTGGDTTVGTRGGPNPYGDYNRKDRVDFSDALLSPEERLRVALLGHYTGNPEVTKIMSKDKEKLDSLLKSIDEEYDKQLASGTTGKTRTEFVGDYLAGGQKGHDGGYVGPGHIMYRPTKETKSSKEYLDKAPKEDIGGMHELDLLAKPTGTDEEVTTLDRTEMDSEAMDDYLTDQASEIKEDDAFAWDAIADTYPQFEGDERASKQKAYEGAVESDDDLGFATQEEGNWWDEVKGLFDSESDKSPAQETKDNEALAGKIGAAAKLYSLLKPETPSAAPTIPSARISRGSVAFPGLKLASQKERRKYYTPKGLMA